MKNFRKHLLFIICILFTFTLIACNEVPKVEKALQGTWHKTNLLDGKELEVQLIFKDGKVKNQVFLSGKLVETMSFSGTYQITDDAVKLTYDNGIKDEIKYKIEKRKPVFEMPGNMKKKE